MLESFNTAMLLQLTGVSKSFEDSQVIHDISLEVDSGAIVALLGPSGSGKTTLLRIIAGLETYDEGALLYDERDLTSIPVHERGFGLVFQDYALFPHKDVQGNVEFGLRMLGWDTDRRRERTKEVLSLVGLTGFESRKIHELSGGEQQRVALARSLAPSPRLLLLDEPMGSLDRALRENLMRELRLILKNAGAMLGRPEGITAIFVTHDQEEAFAIADRVAVLSKGVIVQEGTPVELFLRPKNIFVAKFLGMDNLLTGEIVSLNPPVVSTAIGKFQVESAPGEIGRNVTLLLRPEAAKLDPQESELYSRISAVAVDRSFRGRYQEVSFEVVAQDAARVTLEFDFNTDVSLPPLGTETTLYINSQDSILVDD